MWGCVVGVCVWGGGGVGGYVCRDVGGVCLYLFNYNFQLGSRSLLMFKKYRNTLYKRKKESLTIHIICPVA